MITVVVKCRKHPAEQLGDFEIDPEDDEHVVRVDPCERCIDEAEQDGKDSRDEEIESLKAEVNRLEEELQSANDAVLERLEKWNNE